MSDFAALCARIGDGDQAAVELLCNEYGNALRRVARRRIRQLNLERQVEPDDLFDSVFRVICIDPSVLENMDPLQIYTYLEQMIKHKAIDAVRRSNARKRGSGRSRQAMDLRAVADHRLAESDRIALEEQIHLTRANLTSDERKICMYRADKFSWQEIAELMNITAAAAQKRYERALNRVKKELAKD